LKLSTSNMSKHVATLFINKQENVTLRSEKVNIVLSPAYYWFKEEKLPAKTVAQAKKLLPSIFDGTIPEGEYSYEAIKHEDQFWIFAYNDALIVAKLTQLGIKASQINQIYFAQSECSNLLEPLQVDESFALVSNDNILSMVPLQYFESTMSYEDYFKTHTFTKHHISLNFFQNSFIDEKYIYRLMGIAVAFIFIYFANYLILRADLKEVLTKQYAMTQKYKLPQTSFELNGIKRSLTSKESEQLTYRKNVKKLLSLSLNAGEYFEKLTVETKKASCEIHMKDPKRAEAIKKSLQKSFQVTSAKVVDNTFYVGMAL